MMIDLVRRCGADDDDESLRCSGADNVDESGRCGTAKETMSAISVRKI